MYDFIVWFNNLGIWYSWPMFIAFLFSMFFLFLPAMCIFLVAKKCPEAFFASFYLTVFLFFLFIALGFPAAVNLSYGICMQDKGATYEKCKSNLTTGVKKETLKKWGYRV